MLNRLKEVFKSLNENNVRYLIIGEIAAVLYGVPRMTFDLDILIEPATDNAQRLLNSLRNAGLGTAQLITPEQLIKNEITVFNDFVRIDVQTRTPGIDFSTAWSRRKEFSYEAQRLPVICLEDLIINKKASGREIDLQDVKLLEKIKAISQLEF